MRKLVDRRRAEWSGGSREKPRIVYGNSPEIDEEWSLTKKKAKKLGEIIDSDY